MLHEYNSTASGSETRRDRLVLILIFATLPAAFLSGAIIECIRAIVDGVATDIVIGFGLNPVIMADIPHTDFDWYGFSHGAVGLVPGLGIAGLWFLLTSLMICSLDRWLEYLSESRVLRALRSSDPMGTTLENIFRLDGQVRLASKTAVGGLLSSIVSDLDLHGSAATNDLQADLMRKRTVCDWAAAMDRPNRGLLLVAIAAASMSITFGLIQAFRPLVDPSQFLGTSKAELAFGVVETVGFVAIGLGIGTAAFYAYRSVRRKNERLVEDAEDFSFQVLTISRRRRAATDCPHEASALVLPEGSADQGSLRELYRFGRGSESFAESRQNSGKSLSWLDPES